MANSNLSFDKFVQEAHEYINQLAADLGHPDEKERVLIAWRAVMHTIRDRIQISESFHLMSQLPTILKGIYAEHWKYHDKPPKDFSGIDEMKNEVKALQDQYGETDFDWDKPTEEIISITVNSLKKYVTEGQIAHISGQLPKEVKELVS